MITYIRDNVTTRNIEIAFVNQDIVKSLYTRMGLLMLVRIKEYLYREGKTSSAYRQVSALRRFMLKSP